MPRSCLWALLALCCSSPAWASAALKGQVRDQVNGLPIPYARVSLDLEPADAVPDATFEADLYGERVVVAFVERLRGEERFATVDALVAQIQRDVAAARTALARAAAAGGR